MHLRGHPLILTHGCHFEGVEAAVAGSEAYATRHAVPQAVSGQRRDIRPTMGSRSPPLWRSRDGCARLRSVLDTVSPHLPRQSPAHTRSPLVA